MSEIETIVVPYERPKKTNFVRQPYAAKLQHMCYIVGRAFDEVCYQVGSSLHVPDFHDVDIRIIMHDQKYNALFGDHGAGSLMKFCSLQNVAISCYLTEMVGLPIDFQIQRMTEANKMYGLDHHWREPVGIVVSTDPPWYDVEWKPSAVKGEGE